MIAVERLEQQNFVARVEERHGCAVESSAGPARHQDFRFGIVGQAVVTLLLLRDGFAQALDSIEAGVDVVAGADRGNRFLFYRRGDGRIAHPLGEIDAADAVALGGHGADFGLHDARSQFAERKTRGYRSFGGDNRK